MAEGIKHTLQERETIQKVTERMSENTYPATSLRWRI